MKKQDLDFLRDLVDVPSPSGVEAPAARLLRARLEGVADSIETNVLGSVHATLKGHGKGPSVMIAGHIDEVGMMVRYIDDKGFISFGAIGGVDAAILPGTRVNLYGTGKGASIDQPKLYRGVMGRKPIHLITPDERKNVTDLEKLFIDIGYDGEEVKQRVRIGDVITYAASFETFGDGFAVARGFDDKMGAWMAAMIMESVKAAGGSAGDYICAGTAQEEVGMRGGQTSGYGVHPDIGIAVEVCHGTDYPSIEKTSYGEMILGAGPVIARGPNINIKLFELLVAAAEKAGVPYQIGPENKATGTDANPMQLTRGGMITALVSIPLRYMHTPTEVLKLSDLENGIKLMTQFILDLDEQVDFIPR
ncbi:MAG: M20/M25/M40 family metallo-hydrolase [Actinomycetia bacterium]|nr:M20/M25/M40 family metallo-hydrolase [Actinomycetes bacterium]